MIIAFFLLKIIRNAYMYTYTPASHLTLNKLISNKQCVYENIQINVLSFNFFSFFDDEINEAKLLLLINLINYYLNRIILIFC